MPNVEWANLIQARCEPEPNTGCWLWTRYHDTSGYGIISIGNRPRKAHRVSYEASKGLIPVGLVIDHLCKTPACVNPDHLEPVTNAENIRRGEGVGVLNQRKTACKRGHVLPLASRNGKRRCRTCQLSSKRAYYARIHGTPVGEEGKARGERIGTSRLTDNGVRRIRAQAGAGMAVIAIARDIGVSESTVRSVINRASWAHVTAELDA